MEHKIVTEDMESDVEGTKMDQEDRNTCTIQFFCQFCGETLSTLNELEDHIRNEHENDSERNEITLLDHNTNQLVDHDKRFDKANTITDNVELTDVEKDNDRVVGKIEIINDSNSKSHAENKCVLHKCQFCDATFVNRNDFENHIEQGHDMFEDGMSSQGERNMKLSTNIIKTGKNEYSCPFCGNLYTRHFQVLRHILSAHKSSMEEPHGKGVAQMFLKCEFCEKIFTCESELAIHRNRHTKETIYTCPYCNLEFSAEKDAFQHMKRMHRTEPGAFDKKSVLKFPNPNPISRADIVWEVKEELVSKDDPEKDIAADDPAEDIYVSPTITEDMAGMKTKMICDKLGSESRETFSHRDRANKCPYCSYVTQSSESLKLHVKTDHQTDFKSEILQKSKSTASRNVSEMSVNAGKTMKLGLGEVTSHFQCPFCTFKTALKIEIVKHLNSEKHIKERRNGGFEKLGNLKLRVNCKVSKDTHASEEKGGKGEIAEVYVSGIKVHVLGKKDSTLLTKESQDVDSYTEFEGPESNSADSSLDEEKSPEKVKKSFKLSSVKLEKMKLPIKLPAKETPKDNVINSDENTCPYCSFQSKRASALKFHINFNHQKEKEQENLNQTSKHKSVLKMDNSDSEEESEDLTTPNKKIAQTDAGRRQSLRLSSRKSVGTANKIHKKSAAETKIPSKPPVEKPYSKKRKPEADVDIHAKKLKLSTIKDEKSSGVSSQANQAMVLNVDGTVDIQDDIQLLKLNPESLVDLPKFENDEIGDRNKAGSEKIRKRGNEMKDDKKTVNINNESDSEIVLFVCPQCSRRFESMTSLRKHFSIVHQRKKFSEEEIKIVIEEYEKAGHESGKLPIKLEDGWYRCPFCSKFSQWLKTIENHVKTSHKDKEFDEDGVIIIDAEEKNAKPDSRKKTGLPFSCLFCEVRFENKENAQKHMRNSHESKHLPSGKIVVLDSSSLPEHDAKLSRAEKNKVMKEVLQPAGLKNSHDVMKNKIQTPSRNSDASEEPGTDLAEEDKEIKVEAIDNRYTTEDFFKCPSCGDCFKYKEDLKEHLDEYHGMKMEDQDEIIVVLKSVTDKEEMVQHDEVDHERFQCPVCPLQLRWKHSILKHARKNHPENNITSEKIKPVTNKTLVERYFCPYCSLDFKWRNSIPRHIGRVHQDKVHEFRIDDVKACMVLARDELTTEDTELSENVDLPVEQGTIQICACNRCSMKFGSLAALQKHNVQEHQEDREPYQCSKCPKAFQSEYQLNVHANFHRMQKQNFSCYIEGCSKSLMDKRSLYVHLKKVHGEEPPSAPPGPKREKPVYSCEECNIVLNSRVAYWQHNRDIHNKEAEKIHECKVCGKSFLRPHDLKDHMFVHMSTADLQCPIENCLFKTKKLKYLAEHIGRQHHIKIDSKTLGRHVLSEKQMSAEELNLFPSTKTDQPLPNGNTDISQVDNLKGNNSADEDNMVEPDEQIKMLGGEDDAQSNTKFEEQKPEIGLKSIITDAISSLSQSSDNQGQELPPGKRYNCQLCGAVFPNHRQLIKHKVAEHIEELEVFKCEQCPNKTFFTVYDLKEHYTLVHPTSKDYQCPQCDRRFAAPSHLQKHMRRHQEVVQEVEPSESQVMCDICGIPLRYRASLQQHMIRSHPDQVVCNCDICTSQKMPDPIDTGKYCSICEKHFCTKIVYQCHMRGTHNTTAKYKCDLCTEVFSTQSQMKAHKHQVHSSAGLSEHVAITDGELASTTNDTHQVIEISNEESLGPKFLPKLSEAGLKAVAKELKVYVDEPSGKHWKCLLCGSCFSKVKYFNMHVRRLHVRAEHQPYRCKLCGSGFARVAEFRKHTRTHSGFRPLTCNVCLKSFKQQCHLKEHQLIHLSARSYKCEICQSTFKQRGALLAHVVRHDKLKPFKCHFCGIGFTIRWSLSKHMKKYLDADHPDTHLCHICHKTFQFFPLLLKHIQSHQEPNPWSCEVCHKTFAAYTSFYDHKSKFKHFQESDYETVTKTRKYRGTENETDSAVGSVVNSGVTEIVAGSVEMGEEEIYVETIGEDAGQQAVEIVIQDQGSGEHTTYKVEGHRDVDILSIAKQLTEMSGSLGQDVYVEEVPLANKEEEEKIMMTMLDADEEIKSNLEKSLMAQKMEAQAEEAEGGFEKRYIQLVQSIRENEAKVDGGSYVIVQRGKNALSDGVVINSNSQDQLAAEVLAEVGGNNTGEDGQSYIVVKGDETTETGIQLKDQVAAEVLTEFSRNENEAEGSSFIIIQGHETTATQYEELASETQVQAAAEALIEVGAKDSTAGNDSCLIEEVSESTEDEDKETHTAYQEEIADDMSTEMQDQIVDKTLVEKTQDNTTVISDTVEHVIISVSNPLEIADSTVANSSEDTDIDGTLIMSSNKNIVTSASEDTAVEDSVVHSVEIDNDGSVSNHPSERADKETTGNNQEPNIIEVNPRIDSEDNEVSVVITTGELGNTVFTSSVAAVASETQIDQVEYIKDESDQVEYLVINTDSVDVQHDQTADVTMAEGTVVSDVYEPPILQPDSVSSLQIQNVDQEDGQTKIEEHMVHTDQEQLETSETEVSRTLSLIPVSLPEFGSQPVYMFRKTDGSMVYITVPEDQDFDNNELINAALEADGYIEEHSNTDDSALEAAKILNSVASGSGTTLQQVEVEPEMTVDNEQADQLQIGEENVVANRKNDLSDAEIESSCRIIWNEIENDSAGTLSYQCIICNSVLKSKKNLRYHLRRHAKTEDRAFECSKCHKRFVSNSELNRHMRVHTDFRPYGCKVCGKKFRQPGHLMAHTYTHTGEKPFACRTCPARFTTSTLLKNHMMKHTNLRPFKCDFESCDRAYKTMRELTMHRAVHSGLVGKDKIKMGSKLVKVEVSQDDVVSVESPGSKSGKNKAKRYICHICAKSFAGKTKLEDHIAAHENLRRFICDVCGLTFNTKSAINSHAFTHVSEKPEICEACGGVFKNKKSFKSHQKSHLKKEIGDAPVREFECPSCGKKCKSRSTLYYHIGSSSECMSQVKQESAAESTIG